MDRVGNVPEMCALYVHGQFSLKYNKQKQKIT